MSSYWSEYIQTTEELYLSRETRFTDQNKELWLRHIGAEPGMSALEIGCGGGMFVHKLKGLIPDLNITGLDMDQNHISYAREKAAELGLDCTFVEGDIGSLPFADETFDLVYSHTVAEHVPTDLFFGEQRRVLKKGGRISVLSVRTKLGVKDVATCEQPDEEKELMEKLFSKTVDMFSKYGVGKYEMEEHAYPHRLAQYGFHDIEVQMFTVMDYCPDNASVSAEEAVWQINSRRRLHLNQIRKGIRMAPDALTDKEIERLINIIHAKYDKRLAEYNEGCATVCPCKHRSFTSSSALPIQYKRSVVI